MIVRTVLDLAQRDAKQVKGHEERTVNALHHGGPGTV